MKGKIDKEGRLHIFRPRQFAQPDYATVAQCHKKHDPFCGDWCSLFGEPYKERAWPAETVYYYPSIPPETGNITLPLCHRTLTFEKFTDEREGNHE